jgi:hypothetical protein
MTSEVTIAELKQLSKKVVVPTELQKGPPRKIRLNQRQRLAAIFAIFVIACGIFFALHFGASEYGLNVYAQTVISLTLSALIVAMTKRSQVGSENLFSHGKFSVGLVTEIEKDERRYDAAAPIIYRTKYLFMDEQERIHSGRCVLLRKPELKGPVFVLYSGKNPEKNVAYEENGAYEFEVPR